MVVDTNVLVLAFVFPGGAPEQVWRAGLRGSIVSVTSTTLLAELSRVLARRSRWEASRVERATRHVIRASDVVVGTTVETSAPIIVTGDRDVLDHAPLPEGLRVLRPSDLIGLLP